LQGDPNQRKGEFVVVVGGAAAGDADFAAALALLGRSNSKKFKKKHTFADFGL